MSVHNIAAAQLVLDRMAVLGLERTYVLGSFASPVTFSSQQSRAFNLVWALFESNKLSSGDKVAVIGAGLAGVTAAAAAVLKQCKVTLFEKASQILFFQRGNFTRYVHPNILRWPAPGSSVPFTNFPFLNWHANKVDDVVSQIEDQWNSIAERVIPLLGYEVDSISLSGGRPSVKANRIYGDGPALHHDTYDCVIIAVGFGLERSLPKLRVLSYWDNDGLHREILPNEAPKSFLVSGCGDGGMIDALRLRIQNFKHENFVADFFSTDDVQPVAERLLNIEEEVNAVTFNADVELYLYQEYKKLPISDSLKDKIKSHLRPDTRVTLNSPSPNPLTLKSSILNRFAVFLLIEYGSLHYEEGTISVKPDQNEYTVTFTKANGNTSSKNFEEIVIRHGPAGAIDKLIPHTAVDHFQNVWATSDDPTMRPMWSDDFFPAAVTTTLTVSTNTINIAARQFGSAFPVLYDPQHIRVVGLGNIGGRGAYIVRAKRGHLTPELQRRKHIGNVPVFYYEEEASDKLFESSKLIIGSQIYNYDAYRRSGVTDKKVLGTLSFFARLKTGQVALLSSASALIHACDGKAGDIIACIGGGIDGTDLPVATLHSFVEMIASAPTDRPSTGVSWNSVDAALAVLNPGIEYSQTFCEPVLNIKGVSTAVIGEEVFMLGRRAGLANGTVIATQTIVPVQYNTGTYWFRHSIQIEGFDNTLFGYSDDGYAMVYNSDEFVLGIAYASNGQQTFAYPIQDVLDLLQCDLLLPGQ